MKNSYIKKITLSAMFLAIGLVLPFLTGQIPEIGSMLLPMHIPVLLCGLICGWQYGGAVGLIVPLLRNVLFGMPPMPGAVSMAFELAAYGLIIGLMYKLLRRKGILSIYLSMIVSMTAGRVVWGVAQWIVLGIKGTGFTLKMFLAGAFINAVPGIVLQLILIPAIMLLLNQTGLVPFAERKNDNSAKV